MNDPSDPVPATAIAPTVRRCAGQIRRIDALLRARFPHLETDIYETRPNRYVIVVPPDIERVERISAEFDHSIRFATVPASLSNTRPDAYIRHVAGLADQACTGTMAGLPLTLNDLINLLLSNFPDLDVADVEDDGDSPTAKVTVVLRTEPSAEVRKEVAEFMDALNVPVPLRTRVAAGEHPVDVRKDAQDPLFVWASALRPLAPSYVRADERFWFENIESIAANRFDRRGLPGLADDAFRATSTSRWAELTTSTSAMRCCFTTRCGAASSCASSRRTSSHDRN